MEKTVPNVPHVTEVSLFILLYFFLSSTRSFTTSASEPTRIRNRCVSEQEYITQIRSLFHVVKRDDSTWSIVRQAKKRNEKGEEKKKSYQVGRFLIASCQGAKQSLLCLKMWTLTLPDMNHYTCSLRSFQMFSAHYGDIGDMREYSVLYAITSGADDGQINQAVSKKCPCDALTAICHSPLNLVLVKRTLAFWRSVYRWLG